MSDLFSGLPALFTDVLGTVATYTPKAGGDALLLRGIFNSAFVMVELDEGVPVESCRPVISIKTSDVPLAKRGDAVVVGADSYVVRGVEPNSKGMTMLVLGGR